MSGIYSNRDLPAGRQAKDVSRRLSGDMAPVLADLPAGRQVSSDLKKDEVFYTVYRNLEIVDGKIRYDVTEIPAGTRGENEFRKTFGHYHKKPLPEIYEVLEGRAYFLLQRPTSPEDQSNIKEVYIAEASAGEKAVIPPKFGHLTINVGESTLVLANWIGLSEYDYDAYKKYRGGCYYVLNKGANIEFEKNKNYSHVPEIKKLKLKKNLPELGMEKDNPKPILDLKNSPGKMDWLINPENYKELLTIENLYRTL
ncbi:hypothetical protein A3C73_03555 [Candidatus Giovannonibacteria bacterium RIFCSPHIGHO2_02_FULL_44_11]|uniref:glucose-6-phosphate isomerase n=1 Tax=Candidatus Yanofskybacteria bacterium RIFCSPLOWO2_01_FULL_49_25 TaxID=1802701 RepID=A0A1F8GSJ8_9BACT|nr:MAG: hypothetical protein A3C73_03555 [Candidatus Giovannonibacteria bacterium RIFCSPHIGHO2_02_FULL_44_11]OGN28261.1 MAG: hypothetical protein A3A33_02055 [Candidatus Yanofskybacteria bacterium RIFCSPLOWO2_01_FULL_49_25]